MEVKLDVRGISKKYRDFSLNDISFALGKGTITGLIGENGAGKTTTLSAVMGLIKPDSGEIYLDGKIVKKVSGETGIVYLENNRDLYQSVSMRDYKRFISNIYKKRWSEEKYKYYVKIWGIERAKRIKELSTGMRLKFYLAVELAKQPDLLLLDEPTSGLDPLARLELLDIIHKMVKEEKTTVLFSSHITSDIERIADKVIFLHKGKILLDMDEKEIEDKYRAIEKSKLNEISQEVQDRILDQGYCQGDCIIFRRNGSQYMNEVSQSASLDEVFALLTRGDKIV